MKKQTRYIVGITSFAIGGTILTSLIFPSWLLKIMIAIALIGIGAICFK